MVITNTGVNKGCPYCLQSLSRLGNYYVCDNCKALLIHTNIDNRILFERVNDVVNRMQEELDNNKVELHIIEERRMNGYDLTKNEFEIIKYCEDFRECRLWLNTFMHIGMDTKNLEFRQKLYQLLNCSLRYESLFNDKRMQFILE